MLLFALIACQPDDGGGKDDIIELIECGAGADAGCPDAGPDAHVQYRVQRSVSAERTRRLTTMLRGLPLDGLAPEAMRPRAIQADSD